KTGCAPYLIDWIQRGLLGAVALNGSAAIHDFELALAGKTSEDVGANLHAGKFGMARETADAFAVAARAGAEHDLGLGAALGQHLESLGCPFADNLDGLVCVNVDKQAQYRSRVNVLDRPSSEGIEIIGHHEIVLPLLHAAVACKLAAQTPKPRVAQAA